MTATPGCGVEQGIDGDAVADLPLVLGLVRFDGHVTSDRADEADEEHDGEEPERHGEDDHGEGFLHERGSCHEGDQIVQQHSTR
jgi:hypothetical protein